MEKNFNLFLVRLGLIAGILSLSLQGLFAIETPNYSVEKKDGSFEIRKYPTMVAASTASGSGNSGFGKLFKFISGENAAEQKIAMTSPVFMPANAKGQTREMMFLVPRKVAASGVPQPTSQAVSIKTMKSGRYAVLRSTGKMDSSLRKSMLAKLKTKIAEHGLKAIGDPIYAGYDPPWTSASKRRNEVMLRLR